MARSRNIKPGLFKNEILGEADPIYTLLFAGLWTIADKEGRLEYRPKKIKAELFPYRFEFDVCLALDWLKHESFITVYEVEHGEGQKAYIQINNWKKHQAPHHKEQKSEIPPAPKGDKSNKFFKNQSTMQAQAKHESSMVQGQPKQNASCPTDSLNLIPDSLNPNTPSKREGGDELFNRFWSAYPKKKSKGQAKATWNKLKPSEQLVETMISKIEQSKTSNEWLQQNGQFIPHPSTWLNAEGWEDELTCGGLPYETSRSEQPRKQTPTERVAEQGARLRAELAAYGVNDSLLGLDDTAVPAQVVKLAR